MLIDCCAHYTTRECLIELYILFDMWLQNASHHPMKYKHHHRPYAWMMPYIQLQIVTKGSISIHRYIIADVNYCYIIVFSCPNVDPQNTSKKLLTEWKYIISTIKCVCIIIGTIVRGTYCSNPHSVKIFWEKLHLSFLVYQLMVKLTFIMRYGKLENDKTFIEFKISFIF